jgi:hypothetical protein
LTPDGVQELRKQLERRGQDDVALMKALEREDLKLEHLPKPDFPKAMSAIAKLPDISGGQASLV